MTYSWIKLYTEVLDDPKMGRLPNHLWRRAIELFLLAGRKGTMGQLPSVEEMSWILRLSPDKLLDDIHGLAEIGVVHEAKPGCWVVTNFEKRQSAMSGAERVKEYRKRKEGEEGSGNIPVTNSYSECNAPVTIASSSSSPSSSGSDSGEGGSGGEPRQTAPIEVESDSLLSQCQTITGLSAVQADLKTVADWERQGVIPDDIRDALQWRKDNEKAPVKIISNLAGGVETARLKRIQGQNAKPGKNGNGNGHKPDIAEQWAERARSHGNSANL